jgi:Protein of unknown function (DUF3562)
VHEQQLTSLEYAMPDSSDRNEDAINQDAITSIAQEMHYPLPVVARVFEAEFARLKADARITDYLVLFAARRTRDTLLARRP